MSKEILRRFSIMPLDTNNIDDLCEDIRNQFELGIIDCALFCMSLHPEKTPPVDKAKIMGDKYKIFKERLDVIIEKWDKIVEVIREEVPNMGFIRDLFKKAGLPDNCEEIGIDKKILPMSFKSSKDIREKYGLSRLLWDLGTIDEIADSL